MEIKLGNLYIDKKSDFNKNIVVQIIKSSTYTEYLEVKVVKNPTVKNPEYTKGDKFNISPRNLKRYFKPYNRIKKL